MKNIGIYAGIVAFFLVLSYAFTPWVLSGKIVNQSDISGWRGMAQESIEWNAAHPDDKTAWSDSMFGGMPNVTFIDDFEGDWTKGLYNALLWGRRPASYIFIALLGAFLMMLAMGMNRYISIIGAIAVAFCSYNFQIIQVGHNTKMQAIAFAPWALAALIQTYRMALSGDWESSKLRKFLVGLLPSSVAFGLALSFQVKANHVQITYYLAIIIFLYALTTFVWVLLRENRGKFKGFVAASLFLLLFGITGIGTNANKLVPTYAYTPFTMRGGSELSTAGANSNGLDLDYATAWSYGVEETPNLMIPNFNGGSSSGALGEKSATWQLFKRAGQNPRQICRSLPLYWGPQPFTAGPMYMGAISIFLFILGLCILESRHRWWLLACVVLGIMLGWGRNMMWFTELWFKYAPMYSKFRTVSMALVILQFCIPLLGVYTLDCIFKEKINHRKVVRGVWTSWAVTAGFCALAALVPSVAGDFVAQSDSQMQAILTDALREDRMVLMQKDAWMSFILITLSAGALIFCYLKPDSTLVAGRLRMAMGLIGVMVLANMWMVGKRYLNADHFTTKKDFGAQFEKRAVDEMILEDTDPSYRVLDLSENTFNSSVTSFRHKSIGGYSPTKMQRYQDLIDRFLSREISSFYAGASNATTLEEMQEAVKYMPAMSMLNARYIIIGADYPPLVNEHAFGDSWIASELIGAENPDAEISLLAAVDPRHQAVVAQKDIDALGLSVEKSGESAGGSIFMTSYAPNELHYEFCCPEGADNLAVFSEVYHPSWKAWVKMKGESEARPLDLFRADWVLRAAVLPVGEGELTMRYEPSDYAIGAHISLVCSVLLLLGILIACGFYCASSLRREPKCA